MIYLPNADDMAHFVEDDPLEDTDALHVCDVVNVEFHESLNADAPAVRADVGRTSLSEGSGLSIDGYQRRRDEEPSSWMT